MRTCCGLQFYEGHNVGHTNVGGPQALCSVSRVCRLCSSSPSPASALCLSERTFLSRRSRVVFLCFLQEFQFSSQKGRELVLKLSIPHCQKLSYLIKRRFLLVIGARVCLITPTFNKDQVQVCGYTDVGLCAANFQTQLAKKGWQSHQERTAGKATGYKRKSEEKETVVLLTLKLYQADFLQQKLVFVYCV